MSLQWKIEDGRLFCREWMNKHPSGDGTDVYGWSPCTSRYAATILQSAILSTQERCAQVAELGPTYDGLGPDPGWHPDSMYGQVGKRIASAIRSLNLTETGE